MDGVSISNSRASNSGAATLTARAGGLLRFVIPNRAKHLHRPGKVVYHEPSVTQLAAKRAIDILGAGFGLLLFAPLLIGLAIAIKVTSPGPVFFRQKRYGYHGRRFRIYKFRSMYTDRGDARGVKQTTADDPRITPLGRILRKTSLDELPQLINVFKGDMSLVGPRPHVPGMLAGGMLYEELTPYYFHRHNMRPGITGLAQVSGFRGSTVAPISGIERLDYDLQYIMTWSLWLDIKIIVRTVMREIFSRGSGD